MRIPDFLSAPAGRRPAGNSSGAARPSVSLPLALLALATLACHAAPAGAAAPCVDSVREPADLLVRSYSGEGLPVGGVAAYPGDGSPDGGSWLECDGGAVSEADYPGLHALMDGALPDYRGLFLRSVGGGAAEAGEFQAEAVLAHAHEAAALSLGTLPMADGGTVEGHVSGTGLDADITLAVAGITLATGWTGTDGGVTTGAAGGGETRPDNVTVRWLARAK